MNIDLKNIFDECMSFKDKIKNNNLRNCCEEILLDYKDKYMRKPAAIGSHHCFKGGLLYHTYCVTRNAITITELYPTLKVDTDLVIFGALLHDIGKTKNYTDWEDCSEYRSNGSKLLGHSYEGTHIVENYLSKYELEEDFKNQVLHMIGAHMYSFCDYGTMVLPKMLEVLIIHYSDKLDSILESCNSIFKDTKKGEKFFLNKENRDFYKSINPDYNDD